MFKDLPNLELLSKKPFFELGVFKVDTAVVVNLIDIAVSGFNTEVIAVVSLPPALVSGDALGETVVGPGLKNFLNNVFAVVQFERNRGLDIAAGGDFYLATEKAFWHNIMLIKECLHVNISFAG